MRQSVKKSKRGKKPESAGGSIRKVLPPTACREMHRLWMERIPGVDRPSLHPRDVGSVLQQTKNTSPAFEGGSDRLQAGSMLKAVSQSWPPMNSDIVSGLGRVRIWMRRPSGNSIVRRVMTSRPESIPSRTLSARAARGPLSAPPRR